VLAPTSSCNLPYISTPAQVCSAGSDAARSVPVLGTTAPTAKSLGNPEWVADLEYVWRSRTEPELRRLHDRARRMRTWSHAAGRLADEYELHGLALSLASHRVTALRSAEWAEHRARSIAMTRQDVVNTCDERYRSVACGCSRFEFKVGCEQPQLCASCRVKHARKWQQRIASGINRALEIERAAWRRTPAHRRRGMLPGVYLLTLTAPHSGDMVADRETIGRAVRKLLKHANKFGWWKTYALTWEATGGTDGLGHVHVHMAVVSSWIPYSRREVETDEDDLQRWDSESPAARPRPSRYTRKRYRSERGLREVWRDAIPGAISPHVSPPKRDRNEGESAGHYLAKYVTKGVDSSEFTGRKAGELLCAFRNRRKVSTSAAFWMHGTKTCDCCSQPFRSLGAPCSLQDIAPGAVLRSMSERQRWRRWQGQESFPPWAIGRAPNLPAIPRERKDRRNAPSKWSLSLARVNAGE